ncbi:hypothetical protein KCP73_07545 [Salmonella enterica subsp. enterica]|nr:hypothetical protein KCP73_07545 [Salmonella enterica subsp. enterica]
MRVAFILILHYDIFLGRINMLHLQLSVAIRLHPAVIAERIFFKAIRLRHSMSTHRAQNQLLTLRGEQTRRCAVALHRHAVKMMQMNKQSGSFPPNRKDCQ